MSAYEDFDRRVVQPHFADVQRREAIENAGPEMQKIGDMLDDLVLAMRKDLRAPWWERHHQLILSGALLGMALIVYGIGKVFG